MQTVETVVFFSSLILLSVEDIREKKINVLAPLLFSGFIYTTHIISQSLPIVDMLCGTLVGLIMVAVSFLSKGRIGMGDSIIYALIVGPFFGGMKTVAVLFTASLISAVFGVFYLIVKKRRTKCAEGLSEKELTYCAESISGEGRTELPFVPFTLLASLIEFIGGQLQ